MTSIFNLVKFNTIHRNSAHHASIRLIACAYGVGLVLKKLLISSVFAIVASMGAAQAADDLRPTVDETGSEDFGHIYSAGSIAYFPNLSTSSSYGTIGGRYAHDPLDGSFGVQLDGNLDYSITGNAIQWAQGTAHVTHVTGEQGKIGAFVGFDKSNTLSLGVEGLWAFSDSTWAQVQIAALDPTKAGFLGNELGYGAGASIYQKLNDNFNLRGDFAYNNFPNAPASIYGASATVQYTFDGMPLSLGLSGAYNYATIAGIGVPEDVVTTKLQYSFGGPSEGARGKLFRTDVLGFTP